MTETALTIDWDQGVVTDDSVVECIVDLRRALNDDDHAIIRTINKRGYLPDKSFLSLQTIKRHPSLSLSTQDHEWSASASGSIHANGQLRHSTYFES